MALQPTRITIAVGKKENELLEELRDEGNYSTSEIIRRALKFYSEYRYVLEGDIDRKMRTYLDMLPKGEHVIIDIEHWSTFMKLAESLPEDDPFWKSCDRIARDHAEEFSEKHANAEDVLNRLEDCNFFRLQKTSPKEFTLVLTSENARRFVEGTLRGMLSAMGYKTDFRASFGKIRIKLRD